ncbi:hypothetical protein AHMF7605_02835 [Adhaeribacter arboris]|uniref:TonB C-terminal domain-containing protein n=1 Tax=Adhaeribacter arboris TaxID=2072846 RepID=A0A2T2YAJ2_9BACT|nr:energy transducer TonB [Adhaeribacter arboris]PSR52535.1 hypothetical protein AHMF7605_02835 [Adhaeribacter arboris]
MRTPKNFNNFHISDHFSALLVFTTLVFLLSMNTVAFSTSVIKPAPTSSNLKAEKVNKLNPFIGAGSPITRLINPTISAKDTIPANNQDDAVFTIVEQPPSFPGGMEELTNFTVRNLRFDHRFSNARGTVYAQFIVNKVGKISDIKIVKGLNKDADQEAKNLISRMPDWIPGKQNGKPVNVKYTLPLRFQFISDTK